MTLRQTLIAAPAKTNELLAKLGDTTNAAVKTREKLLADLGAELPLYLDLEEQRLVPVLRKHDETKALAADAARDAKALRGQLAELEAAPKDSDAFLERLGALTQRFRQHLRDERSELLPAIAKALDAEEASALAATIDDAKAEAEAARRADDKAARDAERQARQAADAQAAARAEAERSAVRAQKAAERGAREAVDQAARVVQLEAAAGEQAGRQIVRTLADGLAQTATSVSGALGTFQGSAQAAAEDLRAVSAAASVSARGLTEVGSAWGEWLTKAVQLNADAARRLMACRTLQQVAEAHHDYRSGVMRNWMEANARVLQVAQQTARQAVKPLDGRLDASA